MRRPTVAHVLTRTGRRRGRPLPRRDASCPSGARPRFALGGATLRRSRFADAVALRRAAADPALRLHVPPLAAASGSMHRSS
jgi:hypothetical protein